MKKLLLVTTAIAGVAFMSAPASAAIDLDVGGYFRGYVVSADNDATNVYEEEFRRDSELHVSGETTLDNGLTVGAHVEMQIANSAAPDSVDADEMYAYFSSGFGRVNLGVEDGAAYLLQVEAPSADSNVDGMVSSINGIYESSAANMNLAVLGTQDSFNAGLDYAHRDFSESDRLTYMTPKFNGFQAGVSYTPRPNVTSAAGAMNEGDKTASGFVTGGAVTAAQYSDPMEVSARYDGEYQGFGFAVGAAYSTADLEAKTVQDRAANVESYWMNDSLDTYNVGANVMFQNFSLGGNYMVAKTGIALDDNIAGGTVAALSGDIERETYVIGAAYDNGPYHVGASYLNQETTQDGIVATVAANGLEGATQEADKYTVGGGYSFGPGMTFRGAVAWGEYETKLSNAAGVAVTGNAAGTNDFQQITLGTDIKF